MEEFEAFCEQKGSEFTQRRQELEVFDKNQLATHILLFQSVQYNSLNLHQQSSNMLSLSYAIKEMSIFQYLFLFVQERIFFDNQADNLSVTSTHLVHSDKPFETKQHT